LSAENQNFENWSLIERVEAVRTRGFYKKDGRHIAVDGLIARSGRRRILPGPSPNEADLTLHADELKRRLPEILTGRSATVFERLYLDPLLGSQKRPVKDLAAQFGVDEARIHRIAHGARRKVLDFMAREREAAKAKRRAADEEERRNTQICPRAGECCLALHPNAIYGDEGCQCRRPWLEMFGREPRIADLRHAMDALWQHERERPRRANVSSLTEIGISAGYVPKHAESVSQLAAELTGRFRPFPQKEN